MTSRTTPRPEPVTLPDGSDDHRDTVPPDDYRNAISLLPTGVSVITAVRSGGGPAGCTANAVMSLSLAPPSLLISLCTGSRTLSAVMAAGTFAVNVLSWPDRHLAQRFATAAPHQRFQGVPWSLAHGAPVLTSAVLGAVCEVAEAVPLLDHTVVAGTVVGLRTGETEGAEGTTGTTGTTGPTVLYRHRQHVLRP